MKITGKQPYIDLAENTVKTVQKTGRLPEAPQRAKSKSDRVELSRTAVELQKAQAILEETPDVRLEKVARIKQQIKSGTYKIDSEKIAEEMIKASLFFKPPSP